MRARASTSAGAGPCTRRSQGAPPQAHRPADYRRWRTTYVRSVRTLRRLAGRAPRSCATCSPPWSRSRCGGASARPACRSPSSSSSATASTGRAFPTPLPATRSASGAARSCSSTSRRGPPAPPAVHLQEGERAARLLRAPRASCDEAALRRILDEMTALAVKRGRGFIAWEYLFYFGGGTPAVDERHGAGHRDPGARPRRAAARTSRSTRRPPGARSGRSRPRRRPACAPPGPRGGVHYLQYSFAPRLYIFNAFLQSLIGLHDFASSGATRRAAPVRRGRARRPARRCRSATWATGRSTTTPATSRAATTTSCCASSSRACARAGSGRSTASTRAATAATRSTRPEVTWRDRTSATEDEPVGAQLQRLEAVGGRGDGHAAGRAGGVRPARDLPARRRLVHRGPRAGRRRSPCAWRPRSCARASASATATAPRSRWRTSRARA